MVASDTRLWIQSREAAGLRRAVQPERGLLNGAVRPIQTTSVLTATTQLDAIGAGITAGAGTRLVLQLLLGRGFKTSPLQLPRLYQAGHCYVP